MPRKQCMQCAAGKLQMSIPARGAALEQRCGPRGEMGHSGGARGGDSTGRQISAPLHFPPQTKVAGRVSRLAPSCGGGFYRWAHYSRHQAANIHSVSALLPGGGASWCSSCEGKEWLAPWMARWWMVARLAPWRQLPVCPATLHHHPTFLFIFPQMPAPPLTRTQAEHIRSACEACCARPCYADPPMVPWHHHTKLEKVLLMGKTGRWGLGAGN